MAILLQLVTRKAQIGDLDALYKIELECFDREAFTRSQLAYFLTSSRFVNLVAEANGEIAGFIIGSVQYYKNQRVGHIFSLDVSRSYRRKRVGSELLNTLERIYVESGINACYLEVRANNTAALELYRKCGYRIMETLKDYYGVGVHGFRLKKDLTH